MVIGSTNLVALPNSGSTHNFIADHVVNTIGVHMQSVANEARVASLGLGHAMTIRIG